MQCALTILLTLSLAVLPGAAVVPPFDCATGPAACATPTSAGCCTSPGCCCEIGAPALPVVPPATTAPSVPLTRPVLDLLNPLGGAVTLAAGPRPPWISQRFSRPDHRQPLYTLSHAFLI